MVAERDFDAEHFRNRKEVRLYVARDRRGRKGVVARPHPARSAFGGKPPNFGEEIFDRARHRVRTRDAEEGRHTRSDELGEDEFGAAALPAAFAAATRHVDVLVDQARHELRPLQIDRLEPRKVDREFGLDCNDLAARNEDVAATEVFGRPKVAIFEKHRLHGILLFELPESRVFG